MTAVHPTDIETSRPRRVRRPHTWPQVILGYTAGGVWTGVLIAIALDNDHRTGETIALGMTLGALLGIAYAGARLAGPAGPLREAYRLGRISVMLERAVRARSRP